MATQRTRWLRVLKPIPPRAKLVIGCLSFIVPILLWGIVSYVPIVWHPQMLITNAGSVDYLRPGMRMANAAFNDAAGEARSRNAELARCVRFAPSRGNSNSGFTRSTRRTRSTPETEIGGM